MKNDSFGELQVLIPYSRLMELLNAANRVEEMSDQVKQLLEQQGALRNQFTELMQKYKELHDFVKD